MNILSIVQALIGCLIVFFLSGWLLTSWFHKLSKLGRIIYSIAISISVTIVLSLLLAYLGIFNILTLLLGYAVVFIVIFIFKRFYQ